MRCIHIHSFSFSGGQQLSLKIKAAGILFNESNISLQNPSLTYLSPTSQKPLNQLLPTSHPFPINITYLSPTSQQPLNQLIPTLHPFSINLTSPSSSISRSLGLNLILVLLGIFSIDKEELFRI